MGHEEPGEKGRGLKGVLGSRQRSGCKRRQYLEELRLGLFVSRCSYVSRWAGVVTRPDRDRGGENDGCSRFSSGNSLWGGVGGHHGVLVFGGCCSEQ